MPTLFLKCLLGALAVLLIALLSRARSFYLAGLVPLFPTFALIAHAMVGSERGGAAARRCAAPRCSACAPCYPMPPICWWYSGSACAGAWSPR